MIGNSNINKLGSREVFEYFPEPGFAVDGSNMSLKAFLVLLQEDMIKMQK